MTGRSREDDDADKKLAERKGLSKIGDEIIHKAEIRDGWIDIDKSLLGERALFYPEDWQFRVRPPPMNQSNPKVEIQQALYVTGAKEMTWM